MPLPTNKPAKDIGDAHERLGRDGLRSALDSATAEALKSAAEPDDKSALSDKTPAPIPEAGDFADSADNDTDETEASAPFPLDCLPGPAGDMAREVAATALVPETLTGMAVLGILSASIGAGLEVNSGGDRRTRANLYLMPVAQSGTGKGQSLASIAQPLFEREAARLVEWRRLDRPRAKAEKRAAEARLKQLEATAKGKLTAEEKAELLTALQEAEAENDRADEGLRAPAWITEQATKEAIEVLLSTGTREQLASISAEARGAVDVLSGRYRESTDEGIFLAAYSGDRVTIHRKGSEEINLFRPCLALMWMVQPDKVREMLENTAMTESGLLPRFLIADTKAEPQREPEKRRCLPEAVNSAWAELIGDLLDTSHEATVKPPIVQATEEAEEILREFFNLTVDRRQAGGDLADVNIYGARWGENAWKLALVLHAAEHGAAAANATLSAETAAKAVKLMEWFSAQQLLVLAPGREERLMKRLERLKEVLAPKAEQTETLRELERRNGFSANEVRKLAGKFPGVVKIEKVATGRPGRPSEVVRLVPTAKSRAV